MGRKFVKISEYDLADKILAVLIEKADSSDYRNEKMAEALADIYGKPTQEQLVNLINDVLPNLSEHIQIKKDLSKVEFDWENYSCDPTDNNSRWFGLHTTPEGLTFLGCYAGGDWETPVHFIIYWDGAGLRAYIPKYGNPWNDDTKQAYGNDEDSDAKNCHKRFGDHVESCSASENVPEMLADIKDRILEA